MTTALTETHLVAKLFAATTAHEIETIVASLTDANWRPLGDRANNYAPVNVGANAADDFVSAVRACSRLNPQKSP